jgi:C-terminal peptidase (prc)
MKRFIISIFILLLPLFALAQNNKVSAGTYKLGQTLYYLNKSYLDTVNIEKVTDKAIIAIMKELDPHSVYVPLSEVKAMNEPLEGSFDGVGVEFAIINDTLSVQAALIGGPSEKVGIIAGDKIIKVNGENISGTGLTIERVYKYLRGKRGSKVNLTILRKFNNELLDFEVERDKIPLNSVDAFYLVGDNIAYVRLTRFSATSHKEILDAVNNLTNNPKGIILDFRGNPGGYLAAAIAIANEFLQKGNLIVYVEGRNFKRSNEYANGFGRYINIPTAVLVDEFSASASEIVAGALQDWDRGVIIGQRTFGKGLVQQQLPLQDGSLLRLTVARYHTPSGRVIQKPYKMGKRDEYYKNVIEQYANANSYKKDTLQVPDSLKFTTLKKNRVVYGGGGIMPDIFIPTDTSYFSTFYSNVVRLGVLPDFINQYLDNNRLKLLEQYKTYNDFINNFSLPDSIINSFIDYSVNKGIKYNDADFAKSKNEIIKYIKGLLIKSLYGFNNFIKFINSDDYQVLKAIEVLSNKKG